MSHRNTPSKTKAAPAKHSKKPANTGKLASSSTRSGTKQETVLGLLKKPRGTMIEYRADGTRCRAPRACNRRLHLYSATAALACTRHHHGNCQRSSTASPQRQKVDEQRFAIAPPTGLSNARCWDFEYFLFCRAAHTRPNSTPCCIIVTRSTEAKKSTTKCAPRDSRRRVRRENAHICLCDMRRARNARQFAAKRLKTKTAVESAYYLAGALGFEPRLTESESNQRNWTCNTFFPTSAKSASFSSIGYGHFPDWITRNRKLNKQEIPRQGLNARKCRNELTEDAMGTDTLFPSSARSPTAERMRRHRQRRREGLRCLIIELRDSEIDELIRRGLLKSEMRNDTVEVIDALYAHLDRTLDQTP
jgi:hypothetical protein